MGCSYKRCTRAINSITFKDATIRYIGTFGPRWKKGAAENLMREQEKHVFPVLADMRLTDITTQHVLQAVRPKWDIIPNQMWECLGAIRRILEFARAHGWTDPTKLNPAEWRGHIQHMLPPKDYSAKQHRPALPWQQVPGFIRRYREAAEVPSGKWLELEGGVISGSFNQPRPALPRRRRSRHDDG
jgi:hypothetical protein